MIERTEAVQYACMMESEAVEQDNLRVAQQWCAERGTGWSVRDTAGRGGTAPVFTVETPAGERALKLFDAKYSQGDLGAESEARLKPQLDLGLHACPHLVRVHEGGRFQDRLFILMDKAPGQELEKRLAEVPREKIRSIVDQVAKACIFLRGEGLCHRDIKSANIFVTDDFSHVTLLDLSVIRDVHDPIGLGTDQGGELPVVATSRYSPPEYLFRLISPDAHLWHALDIYQLGGVLHDLIMREPMFEEEYRRTRDTNRYRFAWIVATQEPVVQAADVDGDLILLARRALDKNWQRRSQLQLENFLDDAATRIASGLEVLGLRPRTKLQPPPQAAVQKRMGQISEAVEAEIAARLRSNNITAKHRTVLGVRAEDRVVMFAWDPPSVGTENPLLAVELRVDLHQSDAQSGKVVGVRATLSATTASGNRTAVVDLPNVNDNDGDGVGLEISAAVLGVLGELGAKIMRAE